MWIANLYLVTTFVSDIIKPELSDTQYKHTEVWSEENISCPDLKYACQHHLKKWLHIFHYEDLIDYCIFTRKDKGLPEAPIKK
jgi:hypothetical protein